ncbi:MAG: NAD(P)-dependent oxidoreductase [Patescibacteria group bacterium]|jgi:D-lactate dehydrogenase
MKAADAIDQKGVIGFFDLEGWEEAQIQKEFPGAEIYFSRESLSSVSPEIAVKLEVVSIFVHSEVTAAELDKLPKLKLIAARSTGYDHIDLVACKNRGVAVTYVPGYGDHTVAEYAFGLLLSLTRNIYQAIHRVKESGPFSPDGLRGTDLKGKTIGIVGTGRIGMVAVHIALGFGMNVLAHDPTPDELVAKDMGFRFVSMEELLRSSDVVTLHAPYNKNTHHLINATNIGIMKKGAYLINTARGGLVETDALVRALNDGTLAGAALDVLEEEGEISDEFTFLKNAGVSSDKFKIAFENHVLMSMPNVLVSPHNAFNTQEAMERIMGITYDNIHAFYDGKSKNIVTNL